MDVYVRGVTQDQVDEFEKWLRMHAKTGTPNSQTVWASVIKRAEKIGLFGDDSAKS